MRRVLEITRFRAAVAPVAVLALAAMCLALLPGSAVAIAPEPQVKPPRQDYNSGAYLYRTFCAACHGEQGAGDGPVAGSLRARPPDLATISARRGGQFDRVEVYAAIDGRRRVGGHGSTDMPIWGDVLKATEGHDDAIIKKRIDSLVAHLESLQRK